MNHFIDLLRFPDVDLYSERIEAGVPQISGSLLEVLGLTAPDGDVGAKLPHAFRNGETEPGAPSGYDRHFAFEQRRTEHRVRLPACECGCPRVLRSVQCLTRRTGLV